MDELLNHLEAKINSLIQQCDGLRENNSFLKQKTYLLQQANQILQAKHKEAINQIENMVSRLKLLEKQL